jgi:hypothetical protein
MEVRNTLAYYDRATITAVKCFIVQAHEQTSQLKTRVYFNGDLDDEINFLLTLTTGPNVIKLFVPVIS